MVDVNAVYIIECGNFEGLLHSFLSICLHTN